MDNIVQYHRGSVNLKIDTSIDPVHEILVLMPLYIHVQLNLFITSLFITEYSLSDINLQRTDLFPLKFPLYNRIFIITDFYHVSVNLVIRTRSFA